MFFFIIDLMQLWIGLAYPVQLNKFQTNLLLRNQLDYILWMKSVVDVRFLINFIYF